MRMLAMMGVLILSVNACYYDTLSTERQFPTPQKNPNQAGQCRLTLATGCFQGQIAVSPNITVMNQSFFDANDLEQRFHELFLVSDEQSGHELDYGDYEVRLLTNLDNDNFGKGFEVFFKGEYTRKGKVRSSGAFSIDRLVPGDYEVRVQKPIVFEVVKPAVITADGEEKPREVLQTVCATLYQELTLEVIAAQRARPVFDEFEIMTRDLDCSKSAKTNSIAVRM